MDGFVVELFFKLIRGEKRYEVILQSNEMLWKMIEYDFFGTHKVYIT